MDAVNFGASPIMSAAAALLAAASSLNNGCCEEPLGLLPPQTTSTPTVPLALATFGKDGASRKAPVPVMLMSGFNGSDVLSVLNQLLSGSSQRVGMVISTDYKWARNKHLSAARVEDIIWSEMHCVWHWATQTPCGIFHSLVTLLAQAAARGETYDRLVVVGAPRAEPAILLRDFLEPTRRSSPRFTDRQFHELLQDMVHLDQTIAVVDAEEWEDALNSSMLLADMFEVDTECVGDRLGQVDLLLEQVEYADVVVLTQSKPVPDDRLAHVRTVVQAFNTSALVLSSAAGVAFAVLGAPKHICSFRDPLRGALNRAFRSAASPAPKPAWLAVTPTDTAAEQQLPQFHYLRRRPFHNGRLRSFIERRWLPGLNVDEMNELESEESSPHPEPFPLFVIPESHQRGGFLTKVLRSKGVLWLPDLWVRPAVWTQSQAHIEISCSNEVWMRWYGAWEQGEWPESPTERELMLNDFGPYKEYADRRNELVFIGPGFDFKELEKELDNCLMTEKEMKKLMGIYWPGVHSMHGRDPPNALVDVWRAGEESRRALGEKEARRVRKEVREAEQSQAFERQAEDKRKAAEVETARREEADRKEAEALQARIKKEEEFREEQRKRAEDNAIKRKEKAERKKAEKAQKMAAAAEEAEQIQQVKSLVEWYRTKKVQMSEGDEQQRVAARMDLILGGRCEVQTWDSLKKGPRSNDTCPVCMTGFAPKLLVRKMPCNHVACRTCLDMWFDQNAAEMGNLSCPMCRTSVGCPPPEEYSKLLAEADAKAEAAAAKKVATVASARPAASKEKPVVAPENAPVAVQINKVRKKDRKAAAGDTHSALPTSARPNALVGVISKHFSKTCAIVRFRDLATRDAVLAAPPRHFNCGVRLRVKPHRVAAEADDDPLAVFLAWEGGQALNVTEADIAKTMNDAALAAARRVGSSQHSASGHTKHAHNAVEVPLSAPQPWFAAPGIAPGASARAAHSHQSHQDGHHDAPTNSVVDKVRKAWGRPTAIVTFRDSAVCQQAKWQHQHGGVIRGVNIRLHEHVDKHGVEDPRSVFMSWDQKLSLQETELIEYFDRMAANMRSLNGLPAEAAGKAVAAQSTKLRASATAAPKPAPVTSKTIPPTQPPRMQLASRRAPSAAPNQASAWGVGSSEHSWQSLPQEQVDLRGGESDKVVTQVAREWNQPCATIFLRDVAVRNWLLSVEPRAIHPAFLVIRPAHSQGHSHPFAVYVEWTGVNFSEELLCAVVEQAWSRSASTHKFQMGDWLPAGSAVSAVPLAHEAANVALPYSAFGGSTWGATPGAGGQWGTPVAPPQWDAGRTRTQQAHWPGAHMLSSQPPMRRGPPGFTEHQQLTNQLDSLLAGGGAEESVEQALRTLTLETMPLPPPSPEKPPHAATSAGVTRATFNSPFAARPLGAGRALSSDPASTHTWATGAATPTTSGSGTLGFASSAFASPFGSPFAMRPRESGSCGTLPLELSATSSAAAEPELSELFPYLL